MSPLASTKTARKTGGMSSRRRNETIMAWLFSAPALILLIIFLVTPFLMAFGLSFTDQRLVPNPRLPTRFVVLRNFVRMFDDEDFYQAVLNNFYFVIVVVPIQTSLALLLALFVNQKIKASRLWLRDRAKRPGENKKAFAAPR